MLPEVDLLPKYERGESILFKVFIAGLILCVLLFAVLGYFYFSTKATLADTEESVNALTQERDILSAEINNLESEQTTAFDQAIVFVENYDSPTSLFVDAFITLLPENGYVREYAYDYDSVTVETEFETMSDASAYIGHLNDSAYMNNVEMDYMETFTLEEEAEETELQNDMYDVVPRYRVSYSLQVDHQSLAGEEENDETAISGE
ncbi:hypothetical protein [Oceanobacillus locisalsi]|uniref:Fimbrial assembly protein n=1 Tax=Oceanobacillus locisalsi TaxID=546107 RepID=A0ABW3NHA2_9BACI